MAFIVIRFNCCDNAKVLLRRCVGDIRRKGSYIPIVRDVLAMEGTLGQLRSVIIKAQHNCWSNGKTYARMEDVPIQHEYCVVFKRP